MGSVLKKRNAVKNTLMVVGFLFALFIIYVFVNSSSPEAQQRMNDSYSIEQCWNNYNMKSNTEPQKRFIAGACEKMEADFKAKHGRAP
jgi:hypothetical protein